MALLYQLPCNATAAAAIWRRPYLGLEINGVFQAFNGAPFTVTASDPSATPQWRDSQA